MQIPADDLYALWLATKREVAEKMTSQYQQMFDEFADFLLRAVSLVWEKRGQSIRAMALVRLLDLAAKELHRAGKLDITNVAISELAWVTRNLLEILLLYEDVLRSDESLLALMAEQCRDEIDIYRALRSLSDSDEDQRWCDQQIRAVEQLQSTGKIKIPKSYTRLKLVAERVGYADEYQGVYSLYSKWVHPTAWQIASGGQAHKSLEKLVRRILIGRIIRYCDRLLTVAAEDVEWQPSTKSSLDRPLPQEAFAEEIPSMDLFHNKELGRLLHDMEEEKRQGSQ